MKTRLDDTKQISGNLIEQAARLQSEAQRNETQAELTRAFLARYQLTADELQALHAPTIDDSFFRALERVHQIHADCKLLLRSRHQRAGCVRCDRFAPRCGPRALPHPLIFPPSCSSSKTDWKSWTAWRCTSRRPTIVSIATCAPPARTRWTHRRQMCRRSLRERCARCKVSLWRVYCVCCLAHRWLFFSPSHLPHLLSRPDRGVSYYVQYCMDEVEQARSKVVVRTFIDALTRGGPGGVPRPIEVHAHDPLRYVGDMLACIHQQAAGELELLTALFGVAAARRSATPDLSTFGVKSADSTAALSASSNPAASAASSSTSATSSDTDVEQLIRRQLGKIFDGICRALSVRVKQVLQSRAPLTVLFRLANLVDLYSRTLQSRMLPADCSLVLTLSSLKDEILSTFFKSLSDLNRALTASPPSVPVDLSPPHVLHEQMARLGEMLSTFDGSLVPREERLALFGPVLSAVIDPLLAVCHLSATSLRASDMSIYLINCCNAVQQAITAYDFTASAVEKLAAQQEAHMDTLIEEQTSAILSQCGLAAKLSSLQQQKQSGGSVPLSQVGDL